MRYNADPKIFIEQNYDELMRLASYVYERTVYYPERHTLQEMVNEFVERRFHTFLAQFDSTQGSLETWLRKCLENEFRRISKRWLCKSVRAHGEEVPLNKRVELKDVTYSDIIGCECQEHTRVELEADLEAFVKWIKIRHPAYQQNSIKFLRLLVNHSPTTISGMTHISRARISQVRNRLRDYYQAFIGQS